MKNAPVTLERTTSETAVRVVLGGEPGRVRVETPLAPLTHFLTQLGFYWGVGLELEAEDRFPLGDGHHLAEDAALVLGRALDRLLGDRSGIARYGQRWLPMDEALALAVVDAGGRAVAAVDTPLSGRAVGGLAGENLVHFFRTFAAEGRLTLHLKVTGENTHHVAEAAFKALGMALAEATAPRDGGVRSTKGVLS